MNETLFAELLESVREGGAILQGEKEPSRKFEIAVFDGQSIPRKIRPQLGNRLLPN